METSTQTIFDLDLASVCVCKYSTVKDSPTQLTHILSAVLFLSVLRSTYPCVLVPVSVLWIYIRMCVCFAHFSTTCPLQSLTSGDHIPDRALCTSQTMGTAAV